MGAKNKIAIYGAGGFAREVAWLLSVGKRKREHELIGFIEDNAVSGHNLNCKPVISWSEFSTRPIDVNICVAIGDPQARREVVIKCLAAGYKFTTLIHHAIEISDFVEIGVGSIICCGSILTVNIKIGSHVHVNLDCTIGHDVKIGDFSTLAPGVHVSGNVHIGRFVYIGTGATIINGTSENPLIISDGTVIGAGACITKSTEGYSLYAGVPGQFKKITPGHRDY